MLIALTRVPQRFGLVDAVKNGNVAAVRTLLQQRVDVNAPEPDGSTALHWARPGGRFANRRPADPARAQT